MSESLEQRIRECPACGESSLVSTNRFCDVTVGGTEKRKLPVLLCKACGKSFAVDPVDSDTTIMLPNPSS